jgi:hypothetical protein
MQNKPNFKIGKMNTSIAVIKTYAKEQPTMNNKRYPKQTQSNPISNDQSQFQTQKQLTPLAGREIATSSFSGCANNVKRFFADFLLGRGQDWGTNT